MNATRLFLVCSIAGALLMASVGHGAAAPNRPYIPTYSPSPPPPAPNRPSFPEHPIPPAPVPTSPVIIMPSMRAVYVPYAQSAYQPQGGSSLGATSGGNDAGTQDGAVLLSAQRQWVDLPQPSGPVKAPPPGAAVVQVRVPTRSASVLFDGQPTSTDGTNRYFVTPELPKGKTHTYAVSASWKNEGGDVTKEQKIEVKAGQTAVVDFTGADDKK